VVVLLLLLFFKKHAGFKLFHLSIDETLIYHKLSDLNAYRFMDQIKMAEVIVQVDPHYSDLKYGRLGVNKKLLKSERERIRKTGMPRNQKKRILDNLSTIPNNVSRSLFDNGKLLAFVC
jgi:hypothetical protein